MTVTDPTSPPQVEPVPAVLTLVVPAGDAAALVRRATGVLAAAGTEPGDALWLDPGVACDLPFTHPDPPAVEDAVRRALDGEACDLAAQPRDGRRKAVLVADMESTVIKNEMLDELADWVGRRADVEAITARAMNGELDFAAALAERVALLEGLGEEVLERAMERVALDPGAAVLVATMRAAGAVTALVSGGFTFFADRVARRLGFDLAQANVLEVRGGRLTGRVLEPVLGRAAKRDALERLCAEHGVGPAAAAAVGDGANDLDLLAASGLGVAYHAKPSVARAARFRVEHSDLRALLYFQGFRRQEFAAVAEG